MHSTDNNIEYCITLHLVGCAQEYLAIIITVQFRLAYTSVVSEVEILNNQNGLLRNIFVLCLY